MTALEHNKNAYYGSNIESMFKNSIKIQDDAINTIKKALNIDQEATIARTYKTGPEHGKIDVIILFSNKRAVGANIKAYTMGFNQATRMSAAKFIETFNIAKNVGEMLIERIGIKARNRAEQWIPRPPHKGGVMIVDEITRVSSDIIKYSICGEELPELFVLWNAEKSEMAIYLMHTILTVMNAGIDTHITPRGVISLNPYFTIQRKGGNGHKIKVPKTDPRHGGNNIQVKIATKKLREDIEPLCSYYI